MLGNYHIVHANARYTARRVPCYDSGRYHRHKTHEEKTVLSVCGRTLVRGRDQSCNISIADPYWNYDWCHDCVRAFLWTDEARKIWKERGIDTLDFPSWEQWLQTPEGKYARPRSDRVPS